MNAKQYLVKYGDSGAEKLCKKAGTTLPYFKQIAKGIRRPGVDLTVRLVRCSKDELDFKALLTAYKAPR